jgi:hypothetical protein
MRLLKPALIYFAIVFGAGFVLGPIRILWLVPRVGARTAELAETPVMILVMAASASWVMSRFAVPQAAATRLAIGAIALALVLLTEFTVVLRLRGLSMTEYFATRDPLSGTVYYLSLGLFALLPLLLMRVPGRFRM